jgi:hypothetical protein
MNLPYHRNIPTTLNPLLHHASVISGVIVTISIQRWTRNPMRIVVSVLSVPGSMAVTGCEGARDRPPIIWEGEHIRFGTDAEEEEICAGTLPYLDGVAGHLKQIFQRPQARIDYYWLPDGIEPYCGDGLLGCVATESEAFSTLTIQQHELVHAVRWPHRMYLPLDEGLAEAYGDDWAPMAPLSGDIMNELQELEHTEQLPWTSFPVLGHFVSYLRAEHGLEALLELDRAYSYSDSFARTQDVFRDVYGMDLDDEVDRYEMMYPRCDNRFYRDTTFDCSRNVMAAPNEPDAELEATVSLSCDDPAVLGPRFDQRWTTVTLDVQTPGLYFVHAGKANSESAWPIRFQKCDESCFGFSSAVTFDSQSFSGRLCLDRSRYLFRFVDDVDFDDYEIIVRLVSTSCD